MKESFSIYTMLPRIHISPDVSIKDISSSMLVVESDEEALLLLSDTLDVMPQLEVIFLSFYYF